MANSTFSNPAAGLGDAARFGEIRGRLLFLVGALIVYRVGTFIPVPGINPSEVRPVLHGPVEHHPGHREHVLGRSAVAVVDLRDGCNALYFGVDHHPDDVDGHSVAHGAAERG